MFVAIQKIDNIEHKAFIAETREELENNEFITYDRIEEHEFAEMYAGVIYTDRAECVAAKNSVIKQARAAQYAELIDTLHAEKLRKTVLGEWTEADEAEYVAEVKRQTLIIQTDNPYIE